MKIVKEYINEKFEQDSDPIKDMGIGLREKIKNSMYEIFELDKKMYTDPGYFVGLENIGSMIRDISITSLSIEREGRGYYLLGLFSDDFIDSSKKIINKEKYCEYLVKEIGIRDLFDDIHSCPRDSTSTCWGTQFWIKPKYAKYFIEFQGEVKNDS